MKTASEFMEAMKNWRAGEGDRPAGKDYDLLGANLRWADLRGADLRWAYLSGANLNGADLNGANLYGANLTGANLSGATIWPGWELIAVSSDEEE